MHVFSLVKIVYVDGIEAGAGNDECLMSIRSAVSGMKCFGVRSLEGTNVMECS